MSKWVMQASAIALAGAAAGIAATVLYVRWVDDGDPSPEPVHENPVESTVAPYAAQERATETKPAPAPEPVTTAVTATTTSTTLPEPAVAEEELAVEATAVDEWTSENVMAALHPVCGNFTDIEQWTPKFELLCNVAAISVSWDGEHGWGSVPDLWGWMVECETLLPDLDGALDCNAYEMVNSIIIDYQLIRLSGELSEGPTLAALAERALREQCERALSGEWADDELRDDCADYLSTDY